MLAGAYSKTYQYLEKQRIDQLKQLKTDEVGDAVARAKKLSVETNKRRKAQATKRKLEKEREEKRRQQILIKRREEQQEATEKYQRSHVPSRPPSGRHSRSRKNAPSPSRNLEETLRLVRGNSGVQRQNSAGSTGSHTSPRQTYTEALNRPYFNKYSHFHSPIIQNDRPRVNSSQDKLHNRSLKNLNSSKSLFEQKLEQQQQQLIDQQRRAFNEFSEEVQKEIDNGEYVADDSVSLSSADSLDESHNFTEGVPTSLPQQNNLLKNEQVINSKSSLQDNVHTHQSVRDISFHLNSAYGQNNGVEYPDRNEKIDSYNVEQTWGNNNNLPLSGIPRPEVQKTVSQNTDVKNRPKVQLRAWSTPSPVDSQHSSVSNAHMTNSNPYSSRPSMTAVTSTTAYQDRNSQRNYGPNSGGRDDRNVTWDGTTGSQNQNLNGYSDSQGVNINNPPRSVSDVSRGYTNGYLYTSENPKSAQSNGNRIPDTGPSKPMEFLHTVTNTPDTSDRSVNPDREMVAPPVQETKPSRVPRPVSAVRIQKVVKYNVIPPPSTNEDSTHPTSDALLEDKMESGKNGAVQKVEIVPKQPQVFINTTSGDRPQVKQVTQVKFTANVVNGGVNMNNYGKMNVQPLPNKPLIAGVTEKKEHPPAATTVTRKAKDDADLVVRNHSEAREDDSGVKGILKRPGPKLKKAGSTGSVNSMDVKDSIEIARIHMHHHHPKQIPRKKSVRFADLHYPSEEEAEPEANSESSGASGHGHSSRPVSAKVTSHAAKAQSNVPRAMSAGHRPQIRHKSTIRPQAAAHIITQSNSPASAMLNAQKATDKKVTVVNNNFMAKVPTSLTPAYTEATVYTVPGVKMNYTKTTPGTMPRQEDLGYYGKENGVQMAAGSDVPIQHSSIQGPVFNENGMRIDRTPTDEEINFLWEKVRTCLHRPTGPNDNMPASENHQVSQPTEPPRQAAQMSHQYIDGAALNKIVAAGRTQPVMTAPPSGVQSTVKNGEQTYARRYGLLQQRKQQNPNSLNKGPVVSQRQFVTTYNGPVYSNNEPSQNPAYQPPQDVSESMAAFLTAEHLAQHSMSESQIQNAMDQAQRNQQLIVASKPAQKIPSALSIEEQRLLDSLDRLNERLKITEFPGNLLQEQTQPLAPQPEPQQYIYPTGAFKGKQPLNSQRRLTDSARGGYRGGVRQQIYRYP
ncbi:uncharacterized protein LOC133200594 isoform X2 [Saccostrea echinata]|uniref:uncharacterized protein LOC133200594 isoform X2 n=1 Tax=Saccostrea echinata TaxID=191078 RepID=UPI002A83B866|nr:uncharacterized protein LOC133200594 isoform X2 [Saccostrea echinata]